VVRANPEAFAGHSRNLHGAEQQKAQVFHDAWVNRIPDALRSSMKDLMTRLFPKLQSVWANTSFGADWEATWRKQLRICSVDIFPVYFRLAVPEGAVSRADLEATLQAADTTDDLKNLFLAASRITRPDGTSKGRALLERLQDFTQEGIPSVKIPVFVSALLQVGDELLVPQDEHRGMFDFGNESRAVRLIYHLLKREQPQSRCQLLTQCFAGATALGVAGYLLSALQEEVEKHKKGGEQPLIDDACLSGLKRTLVSLIAAAAGNGSLISSPRLPRLLYLWREWGQAQDVRTWASGVTQSDEGLRRFVATFVQRPVSQTIGDSVGRIGLRVNPSWLSSYIDVDTVAPRVEAILKGEVKDQEQRRALEQFAKEHAMIKAGKNPDSPFAFEEDK
jgi:predicted KAP-like P-loop ATPase